MHHRNPSDTFDGAMLPFYQSEEYRRQHENNTKSIQQFRDSLPADKQAEFNALINSLSNEYCSLASAAFDCGLGFSRFYEKPSYEAKVE